MVRIDLLHDHPELLNDVARAYECEWPQWYGVRGDATADLRERSRANGLPLGLIAVEDGEALGTAALVRQGSASHPQLSPWVVGVLVIPARRRQGIGGALLDAACARAKAQGYADAYTSTVAAARLLARLSWTRIDTGTTFGGDIVEVFRKQLN
jgi:GNAT superfamily N-acetyltransferase